MSYAPQVMMLASGAQGVMGAFGASQEAKAQRAQYESQAQAEEFNAKIARENAQLTLENANLDEETMRRQAAKVIGEEKASIAQSGIGFTGTAADLMMESITNRELDAMTIRYKAGLQKRGFDIEAEQDLARAHAFKKAGKEATKAGYIKMASAILGGASGMASGYLQGKQIQQYAMPKVDTSDLMKPQSKPYSYAEARKQLY